jgi:glutamate-1-semialdehyde aminotransferase
MGRTLAMERVALARSRQLRDRARRIVPGGCHTDAKGDDQYPLLAPCSIRSGRGGDLRDFAGHDRDPAPASQA